MFYSAISYNSDSFLNEKLYYLIDNHFIDFYAYIHHYAEEGEKKNHIHLIVNWLSTRKFKAETFLKTCFEEIVEEDKPPLACLWRKSCNFGDWLFYSLHDDDYLLSKGLTKKYHYNVEDIETSNDNYILEFLQTHNKFEFCKLSDNVLKQYIEYCVNNYLPFSYIATRCELRQMRNAKFYYDEYLIYKKELDMYVKDEKN